MKTKVFFCAILTIVSVGVLCVSCKGTVAELAAFAEVDLYETIDKVIELEEPTQIQDIPLGTLDLRVMDSVLFFATRDGANGYLSVHRNPSLEPVGRFIKQGRGPNEITWHVFMSCFTFKEESDSLVAYFSKDDERLVRWNVSNSICNNICRFEPTPFTMSHLLSHSVYLDSEKCFYKAINSTGTGYERYLKTHDDRVEIPFLDLLEKTVSVNDGNMHNVYSSHVVYNRELNRIAESGAVQNIINIYDLDGGFTKSVQIGGASVFSETEYASWTVAYQSMKGYDKCFACLYSGDTELAFFNKMHKHPVLRLISWDGVPICELKLCHHASAFDFDFENGLLYTLDAEEEELYCYDISKYGDFLNI